MRVLVVEDEQALADAVARGLRREGMAVDVAYDGDTGHEKSTVTRYDVVVLDRDLPGMGGDELCAQIVASGATTRVLMLTASGTLADKIDGLSRGADDYLAKPFEPRELQARIKALLRRLEPKLDGDEVLRFGRLEIDLAARVARLDGEICDLTSHQFDLLVVLAQSPGRVLSRDQIMDALKGHPLEAFDRSIDVHISRIRSVIEDDPKSPRRVLTVRGAGYVFARKQDADPA